MSKSNKTKSSKAKNKKAKRRERGIFHKTMNLAYNREETLQEKFENDFSSKLYKLYKLNKLLKRNDNNLVFLCVGTDKMTGDCFGPIVGTKLIQYLKEYNITNIDVYGTLQNPINHENLDSKIGEILSRNSYIIVIDAALSKKENIGNIYVTMEKTILGNVLNKNKFKIGDISIKAVVGKDFKIPKYNFISLQNVSLNFVIELADIVINEIFNTIKCM